MKTPLYILLQRLRSPSIVSEALMEGTQYMVPSTQAFDLSIADIESVARRGFTDDKKGAESLLRLWEKDKDTKVWARSLMADYEKRANNALKLLRRRSPKFYYQRRELVNRFCGSVYHDMLHYPPPKRDYTILYVASVPDVMNTIGIEVKKSGKVLRFEGNHEASAEDYALVDRLMGKKRPPERFYGNHTTDVVDKIQDTLVVPKGLYLSPDKQVASGYWGKNRVLFSIVLDPTALMPHSEQDWETAKPVKGTKFRYE